MPIVDFYDTHITREVRHHDLAPFNREELVRMSRSRKRHPHLWWGCCRSEKHWKRLVNRQIRRAAHVAIARGDEPPPDMAFGDRWYSPKDDKIRVRPGTHPDLARK